MLHRLSAILSIALVCLASTTHPTNAQETLPQPDPVFKGKIGETYKDSTPSYPQPVKAAKGSPKRAADSARRCRIRHVLDVRRPRADAAHG
jgi:hypothetical protein